MTRAFLDADDVVATFVDFDQAVGAVIRKLRRALGDSAAAPRYIETLRERGYRFLLPTQSEAAPDGALPVSAAPDRRALDARVDEAHDAVVGSAEADLSRAMARG